MKRQLANIGEVIFYSTSMEINEIIRWILESQILTIVQHV